MLKSEPCTKHQIMCVLDGAEAVSDRYEKLIAYKRFQGICGIESLDVIAIDDGIPACTDVDRKERHLDLSSERETAGSLIP